MSTPGPAERFATFLRWLGLAVAAMGGGDRLTPSLIGRIINRICDINQRVARLAALVREGRYVPRRRSASPRAPIVRRPRQPNGLSRKFGWLLPLVPDAVGYRSQLEFLLGDPEMAALLAAAPAALSRPLRSLCWMLRVSPPPILAPIRARPAAPPAAPAAAPEAPPPRCLTPPSPAPPPASRAVPAPPACACGPPLPA